MELTFSPWTEQRTHSELAAADSLPCPPGLPYVVRVLHATPRDALTGKEIRLDPCCFCGLTDVHIHDPIIDGWPRLVGPVSERLLELLKLYEIREVKEESWLL